jgi:hypothetical protein
MAKDKKSKRDYEVGKGKPPKEYAFRKGEVHNPEGINNKEKRMLTLMTREEHTAVVNMLLKSTVAELKTIVKDPNTPTIQAMVAALIARVIFKGDTVAYDKLLDRLIGPVKQEMHFTGAQAPQVIITLPSNGREAKTETPAMSNGTKAGTD